ncbi:hypothetical protein Q5752_006153 [Cryptotrichosporon argae]
MHLTRIRNYIDRHKVMASLLASPLTTSTVLSPSLSVPADTAIEAEPEAGPSRSVLEKWLNPLGPSVGGGARKLTDADDVYKFNAWDHAELPADFAERAEEIMAKHRSLPVDDALADDYNGRPAHYWNKFYSKHQDQFFKDRRWLAIEFPEMIKCIERDAGPRTIVEIGCGAGNTVFPLLMHNENPELRLFATDYSSQAVKVVQSSPMYPRAPHGLGVLSASVWDVTSPPYPSPSSPSSAPLPSLPAGLNPSSVDVITSIYVLSALHPSEWRRALLNIYALLKPGGLLLVRDYGRHDLAQLRIKNRRRLGEDHFYVRGDGTRVYFFEKDQLARLLTQPDGDGAPMFRITELREDRRLLVNRKEDKKMYRIWLQVQARKAGGPAEADDAAAADV